MFKQANSLIFSPSDLIRFMESPYASFMERLRLEHPDRVQPDQQDEAGQLIARQGIEHERGFLEGLRGAGRDVCLIAEGAGAEEATQQALSAGREIVYQALLTKPPFRGYADFLVRSPQGQGYEVWDTKLARKAKPYFILQLCAYAEMLEHQTGLAAPRIAVVLGSGEVRHYRTADYFHYYLSLKQAFLGQQQLFHPDHHPEPQPGADHGRWQSSAEEHWEAVDHLCRVADIRRGQIRRLNQAGVATLEALAKGRSEVPGLGDKVLARLVQQARLQRDSEGLDRPRFELLVPSADDPPQGLALLPPPSRDDVFFDMEGYPLAEGGLEYLFGAVVVEEDEARFLDWWGHDADGERRAFEAFVDWVSERGRRDPNMHIYHYAPYERTALRRLAGRHGSREDEVDELLRNHVLVDLYAVVRGGLRVGARGYSIKDLEVLYRPPREGEVQAALDSIVQYEHWLESGESADWQQSPVLRGIRDYNRDDCESTWQLATWLRQRQSELGVSWAPPQDKKEEDEEPLPVSEATTRRRALARTLLSAIPEDPRMRTRERWRIQELLAHLVEFHRREEKPIWWALFERSAMTHRELIEDLDCLGGLMLVDGPPIPIKRSLGFRYTFDPDQDTKLGAGDRVIFAHDLAMRATIHELDPSGSLLLKIGSAKLAALPEGRLPRTLSLLPDEYVGAGAINDAIEAVARGWHETGQLPPALADFLTRRPPSIAGHGGGPLVAPGEEVSAGVVRLVKGMQDSALCIQGPPGAGKTHTGSLVIARLLDDGARVGITSNSHKAILNLMAACNRRLGGGLRCVKVGGERQDPFFAACRGAFFAASPKEAEQAYDGGLIGGTAWLFSRPEWEEGLDYLFVDEAGQMSLAKLVAVSRSARNLVLLGDQMQLGQPIRGTHPGESGLSALAYLLSDHATIPDDLGVFLPTTWRMHPAVCRFISDAVYESRLHPEPHTANRVVRLPKGGPSLVPAEAGVFFLPVEHEGNTQGSDEEVELIVRVVDELLTRERTDRQGQVVGRLSLDEVLLVAPYNMQVRKLRAALPAGARVGSVDRFQGQEAPVVLVSMCSSPGELGSRGLEFLMNKNRLNVAISRAQSLAIEVGDPRLALTACGKIEDMERLSLFCRIVGGGG